jgi:antitoxin PrlF
MSGMITSRLTSKAQTTIPKPVRAALRLRKGDEIAYAIEPGRVVLTRVQTKNTADDRFKTFSEWDSPAIPKLMPGCEAWDLILNPDLEGTSR